MVLSDWFKCVLIIVLFSTASAECPSACSGKGECSKFDECICYLGYMGNDCAQRICPFGHAHVDGSKGDLNGDNLIGSSGLKAGYSDAVVVDSHIYPLGTSEGIEQLSTDSGHSYMECSNKGKCNRSTGTCSCFEAYEGNACQRASCPNNCSNRGICKTVRELAKDDYDNIYELWDADKGMACSCDPGYKGYDCSERQCPYGVDPLYRYDDSIQPRNPTWNFRIEDSSVDFVAVGTVASARIKFYDSYGEDWITDYIDLTLNAAATKTAVEDAFKALPNDAMPGDTSNEVSINCIDNRGSNIWLVTCTFNKLFGWHRVPEILVIDEMGMSTIKSATGVIVNPTLVTVYDTGIVGEDTDYFGKLCSAVTLQVNIPPFDAYSMGIVTLTSTVGGNAAQALSAFKLCLGDSDGDTSNDVDAERWDTGSYMTADAPIVYYPGEHPHMVKLMSTDDATFVVHAILFFDGTNFKVVNKVPYGIDYNIGATNGVLSRVFLDSATTGIFDLTPNTLLALAADTMAGIMSAVTYATTLQADGDISCSGLYKNCLSKGDLIVIPATNLNDDSTTGYTSGTLTITGTGSSVNSAELRGVKKIQTVDGISVLTLDRPLHYAADYYVPSSPTGMVGFFPLFKFTPDTTNVYTYNYALECSGRGICTTSSGLCKCFKGYTGFNCDTQSALIM